MFMQCLSSRLSTYDSSSHTFNTFTQGEREGLLGTQAQWSHSYGNTPPSATFVSSSHVLSPLANSVEPIADLISPTKESSNLHQTKPYATAKPVRQFRFLDRSYAIQTPACLVPRLNELFKSVCERYDVAVTNREKIDEALSLFKKVLEVDINAPLLDCFRAWKGHLSNPRFIVTRREPEGDVKVITVSADEVPKSKRKAQKHIRDLLDACYLFLQQKEFLQRHIKSDLAQIDQATCDLQSLAKQARLNPSERRQLPRVIELAKEQFAEFSGVIEMFWSQVYSLMHEINTSVYVLDRSDL